MLFFLRIVLGNWGLLWFHTNFRIIFSISVKNDIGILIGITLNLYIALGSMGILTIFIFPIQEHGIYFHLVMPSFFSSESYSFHCTELSPPWLNLFLSIFIVFDAIVNGILSFLFQIFCC